LLDLFRIRLPGVPTASACSPNLVLEEYDAAAHGRRWIDHATGPAAELIEGGTYLDAEDVAGFTRLALPGLDEMMAVLDWLTWPAAPAASSSTRRPPAIRCACSTPAPRTRVLPGRCAPWPTRPRPWHPVSPGGRSG
jgi:hypothetical protein